ncbi:hypothetical protein B5F12_09510 [Pseudoflavonifractor sp. An176]|uniref:hypothetical protein n=1 Tax=Pseudoflavonifractor sp. An176 TaxID=1965572 RepID=UPI000B36998A|nr:hypothetical protein [Pseudoflavonifractor sp. An176]OUP62793.1 hypothetical protein B5F12_09510 [Pseudoflavonifractor sp. An176]
MGYLVGVGFLIAFSVAIGVVATILGLWLGQIILFDSIAMGIVAGVCCHHFAHVHTALSVLVGIGVCVLFFALQNTTIGFFLVGGIFTLAYSVLFGLIALVLTADTIWGLVVFGLTLATVYKGNIIKNLIMDCQSYTKYRPNETTGGIFVSWRRKEELPTGLD